MISEILFFIADTDTEKNIFELFPLRIRTNGNSEKLRARELRNLMHKLSHESAYESAHASVHEDVHGNAQEGWGCLCKKRQLVPTKTPTRVLTGNLTVLTKMYTKVCSVSFHIRRCANHEVQTVNWEGGGEGAVERGVKSSLEKAHKLWIRGRKGAQTVN